MTFLRWRKDGGPESRVWGLFVVEIKSLFSVVLLRFSDGSRDAYHSHAFNAVSWVLKGVLVETFPDEPFELGETYTASLRPAITKRTTWHRVISFGTTWVLSFRGPWADRWYELVDNGARVVTLTDGRQEVA